MRFFRVLLLSAIIVGGFLLFTSKSNFGLRRILQPVAGSSPLWSGPSAVRSAGLQPDEVNNIEVYKSAKPATVYITSTVYQRNFFFELTPVRDLGSGFLINADGEILTNHHVISGSREVEVTLPDQTKYKAEVMVRDSPDDLALIRIRPKKAITYLRLGDSDHLQVGQKVLAIGNPFGLESTLTTGIISALGRPVQGGRGEPLLEGMIQTDAAINSGNSGGPLLDSSGNVIGINTAILGATNMGIGFALPINRAKAMLDDYRAGKSFRRARLGISVAYVAGDLAEALDLPARGGLLVQQVSRGSAAEAAGLRGASQVVIIGNVEVGIGGDLIMALDGKPVDGQDSLSNALSRRRAGDSMELTIYRNGRTVKVKVNLDAAPEDRV
jgi:S1-C subfamily serine protease